MDTYESPQAWMAHGRELYGERAEVWRFACPRCGHEQSRLDTPKEMQDEHGERVPVPYRRCYRCQFSVAQTGPIYVPLRTRVRNVDGIYQEVFGYALDVSMAARRDMRIAEERRQPPRLYSGTTGDLIAQGDDAVRQAMSVKNNH